jgi:hypothetical protein
MAAWLPGLVATLALVLAAPSLAQRSADPRIPPARDPGGVAIALLTTGLDYTQPDIAAVLARDGEGEPIAWDLVDGDARPFLPSPNATPPAAGGDGTLLMHALAAGTKGAVRIVPVRIDPMRPAMLAQALAFVARTPARIVVVPMWSADRETWEPFRQAAERLRNVMIVAAAGDGDTDLDREPIYPAALGLANVLVVTAIARAEGQNRFLGNWGARTVDAAVLTDGLPAALSPSALAAATAATIAAVAIGSGELAGADLKRKLLDAAREQTSDQSLRTRTRGLMLAPFATSPRP